MPRVTLRLDSDYRLNGRSWTQLKPRLTSRNLLRSKSRVSRRSVRPVGSSPARIRTSGLGCSYVSLPFTAGGGLALLPGGPVGGAVNAIVFVAVSTLAGKAPTVPSIRWYPIPAGDW